MYHFGYGSLLRVILRRKLQFTCILQSSQVNHLVFAYGLDSQLTIVKNSEACERELLSFHSTDYIQSLKDNNDIDDLEKCEEGLEEFGFGLYLFMETAWFIFYEHLG